MRILTDLEDREPLLRALRLIGVESVHADSLPPADFDPGFVLYLADVFGPCSKRPLRFHALRRHLSALNVPVVAWNRDAPWNCAIKPWRKPLIKLLGLIDIYLAHSLQGVTDFAHRFHYFANAADTENYNLAGRTLAEFREADRYRVDVAFYGSLSPTYERVRARAAFIASLRERLRPLGISTDIRDACPGPEQLTVVQQIEQIQTSRINLSVGAVCDDTAPSWGLPERCYGVPACGGFLLCDYRRHAFDTFPADAWADFANMDDCVRQIQYYLAHFDEARQKAEALHENVIRHHTYRHRAESILQIAEAWRSGRR